MDTEYMINFSPFRVVADMGAFTSSRSYYGHMANSFFAGIGMKVKQNAKFAYNKKFCVDAVTLRKSPVEMAGTIGFIPVCATKDIREGEEVIVKYSSGTTGYISKNILKVNRSATTAEGSVSVNERNQRANRRSLRNFN
jgi:hypothetical protein